MSASLHKQLLIVDDEENIREFLSVSFVREGFVVHTAESGAVAEELFRSYVPDIVILDVRLPDQHGLDVLHRMLEYNRDAMVIMITAYGDVKTAVQAMKAGAVDYISKPFDFEEIRLAVEKALKVQALKNKLAVLEHQSASYADMIGVSDGIRQVFATIDRVAETPDSTALIVGESGTGKELVARAIHKKSKRRDHPFVAVNCTSLKEQLLESELFGHERGAFTDAKERKKGLFEVADGGTIFLDEIGDMDVRLQSQLLRVLEEKVFRRVGGTRDIPVDVRVIAATNKDLMEEVAAGRFRDDLFYRLSVVPIPIPPLRQRKEDIPPLVKHFIQEFNHRLSRSIRGITPDALNALMGYDWPGNVRELRNVIERIAILENPELIRLEHLPLEILHQSEPSEGSAEALVQLPYHVAKAQMLEAFERRYLLSLLQRYNGNVSKCAESAGIDRSSFHRLLKKHKINTTAFRESIAEEVPE
jgi:DNA-binding NtrC family response regulator